MGGGGVWAEVGQGGSPSGQDIARSAKEYGISKTEPGFPSLPDVVVTTADRTRSVSVL